MPATRRADLHDEAAVVRSQGSCDSGTPEATRGGSGTFDLDILTDAAPGTCDIIHTVTFPNGSAQTAITPVTVG